jgi:hypothetical protein
MYRDGIKEKFDEMNKRDTEINWIGKVKEYFDSKHITGPEYVYDNRTEFVFGEGYVTVYYVTCKHGGKEARAYSFARQVAKRESARLFWEKVIEPQLSRDDQDQKKVKSVPEPRSKMQYGEEKEEEVPNFDMNILIDSRDLRTLQRLKIPYKLEKTLIDHGK